MATVAVGGWLVGSAVFGIGFALVASAFGIIAGEPSILLFFPMLLFMSVFGAGLMSVIWVLPTALLLVPVLKLFGVQGRSGAALCLLVGGAYAVSLSGMAAEWQWWSDFWYAAPIFGDATGWIYARTSNV